MATIDEGVLLSAKENGLLDGVYRPCLHPTVNTANHLLGLASSHGGARPAEIAKSLEIRLSTVYQFAALLQRLDLLEVKAGKEQGNPKTYFAKKVPAPGSHRRKP